MPSTWVRRLPLEYSFFLRKQNVTEVPRPTNTTLPPSLGVSSAVNLLAPCDAQYTQAPNGRRIKAAARLRCLTTHPAIIVAL
jgi:hypothetical protein